jgi:hypothetical protein
MSFPTVSPASLSPSLNEYDLPTFTDDQGNILPLIAIVQPTSNGATGLVTSNVTAVPASQVTAKRQAPHVGASGLPTAALVSVNPTTGALIPFVAASATSATTAVSVSGKFQSTQQTGTGSSQSIPHGLGVIPSLVLVSAYDNTASGSTPFTFQLVEGSHTSTNLLITATSGLKYKVIAFV